VAPWWWFPCKPKHVGAVLLILKCFNNSTFYNVVCVSWKIKCWTLCLGYKPDQLMLCREIIAVCSEIQTKHINTVCGQNVQLLSVKLLVVHKVTLRLWRLELQRSHVGTLFPRSHNATEHYVYQCSHFIYVNPPRLWLKCNRLLRLGRPVGAVTLSRWEWWWDERWICGVRGGFKSNFYQLPRPWSPWASCPFKEKRTR